jgi:hypothetical protein
LFRPPPPLASAWFGGYALTIWHYGI